MKKENEDFNLRARYCPLCKRTHFNKPGELIHEECHKLRHWNGNLLCFIMCEKCLTPLYTTDRMLTNRLYYPSICEYEKKMLDGNCHYCFTSPQCNYNIDLTPEDYKAYNDLMNTRLIWNKNGTFEIKVIDDLNERKEIDKHFLEVICKNNPSIVETYSYYDDTYKKYLDKRVKNLEEFERLKSYIKNNDSIIDKVNNLINPDNSDNSDDSEDLENPENEEV